MIIIIYCIVTYTYLKDKAITPQTLNADPLLDLKSVQTAYKLNLYTIKSIVNNDAMPVIWLGNKRYLRQSDLENYFKAHTKTKAGKDSADDNLKELQEPLKPTKQVTKPKTQTTKKKPSNDSAQRLKEALLNSSKKPTKSNNINLLQAELQRRQQKAFVA